MSEHKITFSSQSVTKAAAVNETITEVEVLAFIDKKKEENIYAMIKGYGRRKLVSLSVGGTPGYPAGGITGTSLTALDAEVKVALGIS